MTDYSVLKEAESNENQEITIFGNTVNLQEEEEKRLKKAKDAESALEEIQTEKFLILLGHIMVIEKVKKQNLIVCLMQIC